jgi:hypothetical protein
VDYPVLKILPNVPISVIGPTAREEAMPRAVSDGQRVAAHLASIADGHTGALRTAESPELCHPAGLCGRGAAQYGRGPHAKRQAVQPESAYPHRHLLLAQRLARSLLCWIRKRPPDARQWAVNRTPREYSILPSPLFTPCRAGLPISAHGFHRIGKMRPLDVSR